MSSGSSGARSSGKLCSAALVGGALLAAVAVLAVAALAFYMGALRPDNGEREYLPLCPLSPLIFNIIIDTAI